jgi:acid stress-induced BolA-like protein IbaG/YrbA
VSHHPTNFEGSVTDAIRDAIVDKLGEAEVEVAGGGGHFTITVISAAFAGKKMLESHRLVLGAIAHLMDGDAAPVHAVDKLTTRAPA